MTWLRDEFDAVEPKDAAARGRVATTFAEAVRLERAFFDAALVPAEVRGMEREPGPTALRK